MKAFVYALLAIQACCLGVFLFGDIGFDRPGRFGLDFSAFVVIGIVYGAALLAGLGASLWKKRWAMVGGQLIPLLALSAYVYLPCPRFDSARYQDLVGQHRVDVEKRIGHPRGMSTGWESTDRHKDVEFISLRGMDVFMSRDGVVLSVEPNNR